jgi:hypothetical protein
MTGISKDSSSEKHEEPSAQEKGLVLFVETSQAIRAETALLRAGYGVRMVAPPYYLRKGCDLAIEFPLYARLGIERALAEAGLSPLKLVPISEKLLEPTELFSRTDFGKWVMVRVANMKITFEVESGRIVNVSGGGCPDVPYLASKMIGRTLTDAPLPRDLGQTVCAYSLQIALEKARALRG